MACCATENDALKRATQGNELNNKENNNIHGINDTP
jgi:hypothetical protein